MHLVLPQDRNEKDGMCLVAAGPGCDKDGGVRLPREVKTLAQLGETVVRQLGGDAGHATAGGRK
jgi:deoxyribonuclease-1